MNSILKTLRERRFRISTLAYAGIGGAVALTVGASLVGWFSFDRVGDVQSKVNDGSVPELAASFGVAQFVGSLVAAAPRLASAATLEEFERVSSEIEESHRLFERQLARLEERSLQPFEHIRERADSLVANIDEIEDDKAEFFELDQVLSELQAELADVRTRLGNTLVPAIDDQLFYTLTGYRDLGDKPDPRAVYLSEGEFSQYRYLSELQADANIATELLSNAFIVTDPNSIEPLRERFEAALGRVQRNLDALEGTQFHAEIGLLFARISDLGNGAEGEFNVVERQLRLTALEQELLASNRDIALALVADVDVLVTTAQASAGDATQEASQAILTARTLLLVIGALSVVGALLIAWLFIGRILLSRLAKLSDWMRRMADGDLEARVEIGGNDEVADMAAALEVFRRHALEVQRLNLVEKLAEDLQGKNAELERVLADLNRAQAQIIASQKLAALGELTAGVAHEIKNPLNFVKNFSEASEDLIEELSEILSESGSSLSKEDQELVKEISDDLAGNFERIRSHGARANRIVEDMLRMNRGTGDRQSTDINRLLEEFSGLAFHSARASDTNFQLEIKHDLDPGLVEIDVIPQDLGRVFLNIVGNSCQATDEKRQSLMGTEQGGETYAPTIWLVTRRKEDVAEIRFRDNGPGIPPDVIDKIFNPFFTTKPTNKGTGLGLSICNDIVREHSGNIQVTSEPGEFTEMVITLPLVAQLPELVETPGTQELTATV